MFLTLTFYCSLLAPGEALTASGTPAVAFKTLSVDRSVIPKDARVDFTVPGYGPVSTLALDTGGAVRGNIVDLFVGYGPSACVLARQLGRIHGVKATIHPGPRP